MSSTATPTGDSGSTRRRVLAGLGTIVAGSLGGCSGRLPGTGVATLDAETTVERDEDPRVLWRYPPRDGDAEGFGAYYDLRGDVRRATVELRNVDTQGTITVPAVFAPPTDSLPDRLHCSFTVRAWRLGAFGQTVTLTDRGSLPLETAE